VSTEQFTSYYLSPQLPLPRPTTPLSLTNSPPQATPHHSLSQVNTAAPLKHPPTITHLINPVSYPFKMSGTTAKPLRCTCGRHFKFAAAMHQHRRTSSKHRAELSFMQLKDWRAGAPDGVSEIPAGPYAFAFFAC